MLSNSTASCERTDEKREKQYRELDTEALTDKLNRLRYILNNNPNWDRANGEKCRRDIDFIKNELERRQLAATSAQWLRTVS